MPQTTSATEPEEATPRTLPDNADPAVDYKTAAERPGTLRGDACLVIQTRQAQRLVYGRQPSGEQPGIIGLVRFGMLMKRLWVAAMLDDPYADWFLLQVHEALESGRTEIARLRTETDDLLRSTHGVEIAVAHSLKPVCVPLQFANPYGYMAAYLVGDFDELVCAVLTARHVGLLSRDAAEQRLQRGERLIRRAFLRPTQWKHCAVDRPDLQQNNQRAQAAHSVMGDLPQEIIEGTHRAPHAPQIRTPRPANVEPGSRLVSARGVEAPPPAVAPE